MALVPVEAVRPHSAVVTPDDPSRRHPVSSALMAEACAAAGSDRTPAPSGE